MKIGTQLNKVKDQASSPAGAPASAAPADRFDEAAATPPQAEAPAAAQPEKPRQAAAKRRARPAATAKETARAPAASPFESPFASPAAASPAESPFASPARSPFASPAESPFASPAQSPFASPAESPFASPAGPRPSPSPFEAAESPFASPAGPGPSPSPFEEVAGESPAASPFADAEYDGPTYSPSQKRVSDLPPAGPDLERSARALARRYDPNIKQANWQVRHGGAKAANAYAMGYWRAALRTAQLLRGHPATPLDHALQALGRERQALALEANAPYFHQFGKYIHPDAQKLGSKTVTTPIAGNYLKLAHVGEFVQRLQRLDIACYGDFLQYSATHEGHCFTFCEPSQEGGPLHYLSVVTQDGDGKLTWNHAYFGHETLPRLEQLFAEAQQPPAEGLSKEARLDDVCTRVGKLHYFLAHHCPFERGSAGVSDMLTTALLHNHGYEHAGWKQDVSADVVALVTPSSAVFAKMYRSLMAPDPGLRG